MNASGVSDASDSTQASSRPMSYREMKMSAGNSPVVSCSIAAV